MLERFQCAIASELMVRLVVIALFVLLPIDGPRHELRLQQAFQVRHANTHMIDARREHFAAPTL